MSSPSQFRRPPTAQEAVLDELRRRITVGEIPSDGQFLQDAISMELGISRAPVREALKILVGEGLVTYEPYRGYFVRILSLEELLEVYRIRTLLETELARIVTPLVTQELIEQLEAHIDSMEASDSAGDITKMQETNRAFHFTIFEASEQPHFVNHLRTAWNQTDPFRALYYSSQTNRQRVHDEHRQIVYALRTHDLRRLVDCFDEHREHAIDEVRDAIKRRAGSTA